MNYMYISHKPTPNNSHTQNNDTLKIPLRCGVLIQTVQLIL